MEVPITITMSLIIDMILEKLHQPRKDVLVALDRFLYIEEMKEGLQVEIKINVGAKFILGIYLSVLTDLN